VEDCGAERGVYAVVWVSRDGERGRVVHAVEGQGAVFDDVADGEVRGF